MMCAVAERHPAHCSQLQSDGWRDDSVAAARAYCHLPQPPHDHSVTDGDDGLVLLAAVRNLRNQAWARRDEIEPKWEGRRVPRPLDVYDLLPRTNCGACGEVTCMACAFGLLESRRRPEERARLVASQAAAYLHAMIALLCDIGEAPAGGACTPWTDQSSGDVRPVAVSAQQRARWFKRVRLCNRTRASEHSGRQPNSNCYQ